MQDIVARIISVMDERGITGVELAKILKKEKSPVTDWKNDRSKPTLQQIMVMCEYFALSADYLLFGNTSSSSEPGDQLSKDERFLLSYYRQLDEQTQAETLKDIATHANTHGSAASKTDGVGQDSLMVLAQKDTSTLSRRQPPPGKKKAEKKQA